MLALLCTVSITCAAADFSELPQFRLPAGDCVREFNIKKKKTYQRFVDCIVKARRARTRYPYKTPKVKVKKTVYNSSGRKVRARFIGTEVIAGARFFQNKIEAGFGDADEYVLMHEISHSLTEQLLGGAAQFRNPHDGAFYRELGLLEDMTEVSKVRNQR